MPGVPAANDRTGVDETRDVAVARRPIQSLGSIDLDDHPVFHDRDTVCDRTGFLLVVGDVDQGGAGGLLDADELVLHLAPYLEVERPERLIEQQYSRALHERARERDALLLTARKF